MTETLTEESSIKKRGRPRTLDRLNLPGLAELYRSESPRTAQNRALAFRAIKVLGLGDPNPPAKFLWLGDARKINDGAPGYESQMRWTLLTELGRILLEQGEEATREAAELLCLMKPTAKAGEAMLRRWRTGRAPKPDRAAFADELLRTLNRYIARHPDMTRAQIVMALRDVRDAVTELDLP